MARATTASQLARTISPVRAVDGTRLGQDAVRQARWQHREDGMIEVRAVLPAEMGAEVVTALELALDRDGQAAAATHAAETDEPEDRKSTRLNSSHVAISYAVFCLKKKNKYE